MCDNLDVWERVISAGRPLPRTNQGGGECQDFEEAHLLNRLVETIEAAPYSLQRGANIPYDQCQRLRLGLAFSEPEDCDCGLDALLVEAKEYIGNRTGDKRNYLLAPRVPTSAEVNRSGT